MLDVYTISINPSVLSFKREFYFISTVLLVLYTTTANSSLARISASISASKAASRTVSFDSAVQVNVSSSTITVISDAPSKLGVTICSAFTEALNN